MLAAGRHWIGEAAKAGEQVQMQDAWAGREKGRMLGREVEEHMVVIVHRLDDCGYGLKRSVIFNCLKISTSYIIK